MKVASYRRAPEEETGPLQPATAKKCESQDAQIEELTKATQNNLKFQDNFQAVVLRFSVADSSPIRVSVKGLKTKPARLLVDWTSVFSPWSHCWQVVDQETIQFMIQWATPPSGTATVLITVFGE